MADDIIATARAGMDANLRGFWGPYGRAPGSSCLSARHDLMIFTGIPHPLFNGAYIADGHARDIQSFHDRLQAEQAETPVPAMWWVNEAAVTDTLAAQMGALGLGDGGRIPAMAADLEKMPEDPLPKGLEITQVQSEQDRVLWGELAARCIGAPEAVASALGQVEAGIEDCELDGCRRYLAFQDGTPVGTASLVLTPHLAGLYAVGTLPEMRGKGIGRALTLHALNHARHADCRVGVLQASSMGKPLYEKLGFQTLFDYVIYVQTP